MAVSAEVASYNISLFRPSLPSRPLVLERTGQPQHRGLIPPTLLEECVGSVTSHRELMNVEGICETEPTVYSPFKHLEMKITKAALSPDQNFGDPVC